MEEGNFIILYYPFFGQYINCIRISAFCLLMLLVLIFSSCEKVIFVDLNNSDPHPVVEANITNLPGPYIVKLTRSLNYYDSNTFPPITDATVTVSDNAGNSEIMKQTTGGIYQSATLTGTPGRTYTLTILYNGNEYYAVSTMPGPVPVDSVIIEKNVNNGFGEHNNIEYRIITYFKDPPGLGNYYRLQLTSNDSSGIDQNRNRLLSDKLIDGAEMSMSYNTKLVPGDSVTVKLESIDESAFNFYTTLEAAVADGTSFLSAPPANPVNNISNNGLGYFAAYSLSEKHIIIPN
ncbi:MAG: DUF4249 domain-containing protein [Bacteroidia bacterium]|nr:DUF4249 domain-containing protein [Bacteroidia bacterium]